MLDLFCPTCGLATDLETCMCCGQTSLVCHHCQLLLGRFEADALVRELHLTIPRSRVVAGESGGSEKANGAGTEAPDAALGVPMLQPPVPCPPR